MARKKDFLRAYQGLSMRKAPFGYVPTRQMRRDRPQSDFEELEATELYCPKCRRAVPVRKFLLLILPDGDRYEYRCQFCGTKVGDKIDHSGQFYGILKQ
jgi:uncharacterized protein YbaR (Trm112 family)